MSFNTAETLFMETYVSKHTRGGRGGRRMFFNHVVSVISFYSLMRALDRIKQISDDDGHVGNTPDIVL